MHISSVYDHSCIMARGSKLLSDDISDSGSSSEEDLNEGLNADEIEERKLLDPYSRKRKRGGNSQRNGKVDALYGIFAPEQDDEAESEGGHAQSKRRSTLAASSKMPTFVPSAKSRTQTDVVDNLGPTIQDAAPTAEVVDMEVSGSDSDTDASDGSDDEADEPEDRGEKRVQPDYEEEPLPLRAGLGGIGSSSRSGIGNGPIRGGIGSSTPATQPAAPTPAPNIDISQTFGARPAFSQRSFASVRSNGSKSGTSTPKPAVPLSREEQRHFAKLETQGGMGYKLLAKMGWTSGSGLGTEQQGRVTPVDQSLRPKGRGLGHGGYQEKTKASREEAKRSVYIYGLLAANAHCKLKARRESF